MKFRICPYCNSNLDYSERCDCRDKKEAAPLARERPQGNYATAIIAGAMPYVNNLSRINFGKA